MPTTRPRTSASAPPELPGFSAASVWMTFSTSRLAWPSRAASERPRALTRPGGHRPGEAERIADGDDQLADPKPGRVAERRGGQPAAGRAHDRQVRERVPTDDLEVELVAVDERRGSPLGAGDDVGVRDEIAVGRERHGGPAPPPQPPRGARRGGWRPTGSAARPAG